MVAEFGNQCTPLIFLLFTCPLAFYLGQFNQVSEVRSQVVTSHDITAHREIIRAGHCEGAMLFMNFESLFLLLLLPL